MSTTCMDPQRNKLAFNSLLHCVLKHQLQEQKDHGIELQIPATDLQIKLLLKVAQWLF